MRQKVDITQVNLIIQDIGATTKTIPQLIADYPDAKDGQEVHSDTQIYKRTNNGWVILDKGSLPAFARGLVLSGDQSKLFIGLADWKNDNEINLTGVNTNLIAGFATGNLYWSSLLTFAFEIYSTDTATSFQIIFYKDISEAGEEELGRISRVATVPNEWDRITETFLVDKTGTPFSTGETFTVQAKARILSGAGSVKIRKRRVYHISN